MDPTTPVDVFVGVQSGSAGQGSHRPRANTEGGMHMPNPYEHPVHPGGASTLPRADFGMRSNGGGEHGDIPPPPCHAPPPLTHSSLEIFARMRRSPTGGGGKNGHQHQQQKQSQRGGGEHQHHGMSHRSFSTTQTAGLISPTSSSLPNSGSMRMIRSAGQLHPLEEKSSQELGPEYATVYPPMPMEGKVATLERQPPPRRGLPHSPNQPPPHGGAYVPNGSNRSTRNSDDFSSFSEMTDTGSAQLSMGQAGHGHMPAPLHSPRHPEMAGSYHLSGQRESVFSETSNEEQSLSSGSIREASPSGEEEDIVLPATLYTLEAYNYTFNYCVDSCVCACTYTYKVATVELRTRTKEECVILYVLCVKISRVIVCVLMCVCRYPRLDGRVSGRGRPQEVGVLLLHYSNQHQDLSQPGQPQPPHTPSTWLTVEWLTVE